jgi:nitrogen fixation/metabolism regulation signal transduction histidine kinase
MTIFMTIGTIAKVLSTVSTAALLAAPGSPLTPVSKLPPGFPAALFAGGIVMIGVFVLGIAIYKSLRNRARPAEAWIDESPGTANPSAFATASMQGVIEKLRTQEKELERLHRMEKERAQESERLTEEVTRNMPTGLLLVGATGAITTANPAAETALGFRGLQFRSYREVLGKDSDLSVMLSSCLREGQTYQRGEVQHTTPAGDVRQLGVTISPILRTVRNYLHAPGVDPFSGHELKVTGALCLMSDLTELAALQRQIRWKENLAALGEMSAGIAHEFKNSLATISGYAQLLRSEAPPGEMADCANRILGQTRALTHVVTEFLKFARPIEISYETVHLQSVVEKIAVEVRDVLPQCQIEVTGGFAELPGDEALLHQAIVNLVRNAGEAMREDAAGPAQVTISATIEDLGGRKWQRICVADRGPGIPAADISRIFVPFFTTKSDGTGLGLAVVQKVALQHGGSVEARNRTDGPGAEFLLWLPLRQKPTPVPIAYPATRI